MPDRWLTESHRSKTQMMRILSKHHTALENINETFWGAVSRDLALILTALTIDSRAQRPQYVLRNGSFVAQKLLLH